MAKILIFSELYWPNISGGAERSTQLLAESLISLGHSVTVCCTSDTEKEDIINGVTVLYLKTKNIYWPYKDRHKGSISRAIWHIIDADNVFYNKVFNKLFLEYRPDVIHTNNICGFSCAIWRVASSLGIPIVHTLRDYYLMCPKTTMYREKECTKQCLSCKLLSYPKLKLSGKVSAVVGISHYILDKHIKQGYFASSGIQKVISNPIGEIRFNPKNKPAYAIGYIGSISNSKGVDLLVKSFDKLKSSKYKLLIAGKGSDEYIDYLKSLVTDSMVEFKGFVNPSEFLASIDLLVVPSQWNEPFGRVVIEAVASGVPVIGSSMGGIPEILKGRKEGVIFSSQSQLQDLLAKYIEGNLTFDFDDVDSFISSYNATKVAKAYCEVYSRLLSANKL